MSNHRFSKRCALRIDLNKKLRPKNIPKKLPLCPLFFLENLKKLEIGIPKDKHKKGSNPRSYRLMLSEIVLKRKGKRKKQTKISLWCLFHDRNSQLCITAIIPDINSGNPGCC